MIGPARRFFEPFLILLGLLLLGSMIDNVHMGNMTITYPLNEVAPDALAQPLRRDFGFIW